MTRGWASAAGKAAIGGLVLAAATPPALVPFGGLLVVPALMLWFAQATGSARPLLQAYVYGCVHMAWFSWSVRHVVLFGYAAIVLLGGVYYLLATAATRGVGRRWQPLVFAAAVAGAFWLRAAVPQIHYPHGQPCHALWQWPALLGSVALGGEPLANALLAGLAAAAVLVVHSWRVAVPAWGSAMRGFAAAVAAAAGATIAGWLVHGWARYHPQEPPVRIAAVEPGYHPFELFGLSAAQYRELVARRLIEPTRQLLRGDAAPELVLWPESSIPDRLDPARIAAGNEHVLRGWFGAESARLLVGAEVRDGRGSTPSALLVALPSGRVLGHHDKRRLVPGGEFLPLLSVVPAFVGDAVRGIFERALGAVPDCVPGSFRPPLETAAGVPFGALLCYDNAFPGPAQEQVAAGARFLVVLSNEAWYRGGGELEQLVAMTVVRALENATPIVRCTQDGWSVVVDADGRIGAQLPQAPAPQPAARILQVSVSPGAGREPAMAWLRRAAGPISGLALGLAVAHALWRWVRLRSASSAPRTAASSGPSGGDRGGS